MIGEVIRETPTHVYYKGILGPISVAKKTRKCTVCGKPAFFNADEMAFHRQHGGKLVRVDQEASA